MMSVVQRDSEGTAQLLFIIGALLQNSLERSLFPQQLKYKQRILMQEVTLVVKERVAPAQ